jgi:hypothetical protein
MSRYTVTAERSNRWWVLQAVEVPGAISQVSRLDQADEIKEAIAFVVGVREEDVEIDVVPVLPPEATRHLELSRRLRQRAQEVDIHASAEQLTALNQFVESGLSFRDIGHILSISHQRVHQLVSHPDERVVSWLREKMRDGETSEALIDHE